MRRSALVFVLLGFLCLGCGSQANIPTNINNVTLTPVSATIDAGKTQQFTATVYATGDGTIDRTVTFSQIGNCGTVAPSGIFTAANVTVVCQGKVKATSVEQPSVSASADITVNPQQPQGAPAILQNPTSQTVTTGQTATFSVVSSGTPPLSYQWQKNGAPVAGATAASYTTPATTSADNGSWYFAVVSNSAGSATSASATLTLYVAAGGNATVAITLPPPPHIDNAFWNNGTVQSTSFFCYTANDCGLVPFSLNGQYFMADCVQHSSGFNDITLPAGTSPTQDNGVLPFDSEHIRPRYVDFSITCPATGQASNTAPLAFIGNQNMSRRWGTKLNYLDPSCGVGCSPVGRMHVFDVSNLTAELASWGSDGNGTAVDPSTDVVVNTTAFGVSLVALANPSVGGTSFVYPNPENPSYFMGAAAADKNVVATQVIQDSTTGNFITGNLVGATYDVVQQGQPVQYLPVVKSVSAVTIGTAPMGVEITKLNGQSTAVVLSAGDGAIVKVPLPLPSEAVPGTPLPLPSSAVVLNLPGFTKATSPYDPQKILGGSWLAIIEQDPPVPAPPVRRAFVVDRAGGHIWFADLIANTVSGPFPLNGDAFRVAADNVHGATIVAFTSVVDDTTTLVRIMPDGTLINITGSFPFLAGGLAADAANIYGCGNASDCKSVPNQ